MLTRPLPWLAFACVVLALDPAPAKASDVLTVISGFSVLGPGQVTESTGPGVDAPPLDLPTFNVGYLQLYDPKAAAIAPDATGQFSFSRAQGIVELNIQSQDTVYNLEWRFDTPASYVDFTLDSGVVTDFHFHALTPEGSYADLTPTDFGVHFVNGPSDIYDFSGQWTPGPVQMATRSIVVPEPSVWTTLIIGLGLAGVTLRGRRRSRQPAVTPRLAPP